MISGWWTRRSPLSARFETANDESTVELFEHKPQLEFETSKVVIHKELIVAIEHL
jgi:hypothetical protein